MDTPAPSQVDEEEMLANIEAYFDSLSEDEIMGEDATIYELFNIVRRLKSENARLETALRDCAKNPDSARRIVSIVLHS